MNPSSEKISLTPSQTAVLGKYLLEDRSETYWEDVARRTSKFVASAEKTPALQKYWEEQFYSIIAPMKFMPGGSILANSDHGTKGLLNCFVLSAEDNLESITKLICDAIMTTRFRGGVGINIGSPGQPGYIRPKGAPFKDGKALGPCAVLDMVSDNVKRLTTGNKARRGALLYSVDWRHPDIWEFIGAKTQSTIDASTASSLANELATVRDTGNFDSTDKILEQFRAAWTESHLSPDGKRDRRWHNANISVQLDDEFFATLREVGEVEQRFEQDFDDIDRMGLLGYDYMAKLRWVKELWDAIAICAHATADPGLLLMSNMKRHSPIRDYILTTNPCGELALPKDSACDLGSIVLTKFVKQLDCVRQEIDWKDLERTIEIAVRFLDNVLDKSEFATPEQKHSVQNVFRQIGLGIMGWADYLKLARIPYDSQSHLDEIDRWGYFIATRAYRASEALAEEKGVCGIWKEIRGVETFNTFERWYNPDTGEEVDGSFFDKSGMIQRPRRNATVLSIAPTGSIAQLSGASWAFEPDFGLSIWKQVFVDASAHKQQWVQILNPHVEELGLDDRDRELVLKTGSVQQTEWAHSHPLTASAFKIAKEIAPGWHVLVQSRWQKWIDSSISKTINLPAETTVEQIKEIYLLANKLELKGITVYREGTLESEPIVVGGKT